jgi:flagellar basal-body rod protein FlgC
MIAMFETMEVLASGLSVARLRVNTLASNLANAQTTRTDEGGPYRRRDVVQVAKDLPGTFANKLDRMSLQRPAAMAVVADQSEPRKVFQPGHPDADNEGYVAYPNVNMVQTMTDLMMAQRLYQASLSAMSATKDMMQESYRIGTSA